MHKQNHDELITEQFTKQADAFARHHASDNELMDLLLRAAQLEPTSQVLDVACGPGIVTCALAKAVRHVTGMDLVPAMLERAELTRKEQNLANVTWREGSATALPFPDESFDAVVTRFSFHHYLHPQLALQEMARVCKKGGTVLVCDVSPRPECRAAYDEIEQLRDPSHTSALLEEEFLVHGAAANLTLIRKESCCLKADLEKLLAASFPPPGNADRVRARLQSDLLEKRDRHGMNPFLRVEPGAASTCHFYFPVLVLVWNRPAA